MANRDLLTYVKKNSSANCLKLLLQVAKGVEYLHTLVPMIVHGDLRAANVFISSTGDVRIADFGLAHGLVESGGSGNSSAWKYGGNPRWQAPEIINATTDEEAERTEESDMFAFGRVAIEVYTQNIPFAYQPATLVVVTWVASGKLPTRPMDEVVIARGLDDRMWGLVKDCCHKRPSSRPTAGVVVRKLQTALEVRDGGHRPPPLFTARAFFR